MQAEAQLVIISKDIFSRQSDLTLDKPIPRKIPYNGVLITCSQSNQASYFIMFISIRDIKAYTIKGKIFWNKSINVVTNKER